jgi:putative CocE/NonD family hydrolase
MASTCIAQASALAPPRDQAASQETAPPALQSRLTIRMRDGVELAADLFRPAGSHRLPAILIRTPYDRKNESLRGYRLLARHGYAVIIEDVRGRYGSGGEFGPIEQEGPDGSDTINWIADQPWSDGRVGMAGASYLGIVQWRAAVQSNPHLVAIFPMVSGDDEYLDRFYSPGGALKLGHRLLWIAENFHPFGVPEPPFLSYVFRLPLRAADRAAAGITVEQWQQALDHPRYDAHWERLSIRREIGQVRVAVFSIGGWFDNYAPSDLDAFARLSKTGRPMQTSAATSVHASAETSVETSVETWIGPWGHTLNQRAGQLDFGSASNIPIRSLQLAFFDRWLKPANPAPPSKPRLNLFVIGPNIWREEHEWPLARTFYRNLYLGGDGQANTAAGDGILSFEPPHKAKPDHFIYDPVQPVPTTGGSICCNARVLPPGSLDQSAIERRNDVLVYTSAPLLKDLEVTGPVRALLYVATSANDTDFTAKLVDVTPSNTPLLVTDGILRMRYRLSLAQPSFVKSNMPYQVMIDAGVTSWVFAAGHRIRLEISSSNFPRFDRNLNSTGNNADLDRSLKAAQTVFHEKKYPSGLILPAIPKNQPIN